MAEKSPPPASEVDLFGDPWTPPKDPRGRKAHERNSQVAEKVGILRATGATEEEIATRVGLSDKTLRKYYSRELKSGPALAQALIDEAMFAKALKGVASAAKYMKDRFAEGEATLADGRLRQRAMSPTAPTKPDVEAPEPKMGKKAQRQATADEIGESDRFAQSRAPKLVVSNP